MTTSSTPVLTKSDLAKHVAQVATALTGNKVSVATATAIIDETLATISVAVAAGSKVSLRGFGGFSPRTRHARIGRNPRSGAAVEIPSKTTMVFKASKPAKSA